MKLLNHRKNKFLSIGRNKGFSSQKIFRKTFSMKKGLLINLIKNQKIIYITIAINNYFYQ